MIVESHHPQLRSESETAPDLSHLFPLPLTPFEWFMLLEDRPQWPMTFCVQLNFRGSLDRKAFETAVRQTVARHPLLRSRVEFVRRVPQWVPAPESQTEVTWLSEEDHRIADTIGSLDISRTSGLRVMASNGTEYSHVWLHVHHACCDGQAARRFIVDLMTGYARACSSQSPPEWDQLDYESLRTRHVFAPATGELGAQTTLWQKLRGAYHFHILTPRPLARVNIASTQTGAPIVKHVFDAEFTARLREQARLNGVSLNDVAMALLFRTLAAWNRLHGDSSVDERLRVLMPTDLRGSIDDRMPAANRMSYSFIGRTIRQCQDEREFLTGIRAETRYIKQVRIGLDFLGGIALAQHVPGLVPILSQFPRCMATAVLTNLGDPTKRFRRRFPSQGGAALVGNVLLDSIIGTPPIRPYTHAGFGMCLCAGKLGLSMLGNADTFGTRSGELFESFLQHWRDFGSSTS
jgi:hypothetical protein